jgi:tetratricopeptide (TPR) repeat protein
MGATERISPFSYPAKESVMRRFLLGLLFSTALCVASVQAANEGQADLDQATELQVTAETLGDLEKVIALGESALKKGLDEGQAEFARQMLAATLYQHANRLAAAIFEQQPPSPKWPLVRQYALKDLEKAKTHDPKLPDIYLLTAKLQILPGGEAKGAEDAINEAIRLLKDKDQPEQLAKAYVLRAQLTDDKDRKLADYERALKADAGNVEALQGRALHYLEQGDDDKAIESLTQLVEKQANNPGALGILAEALTNAKKYDEALKYSDKVIEVAPKSTLGYNLRARIKVLKDDLKGAIEDLNKALEIDSRDVSSLLMRGRLLAAEGKATEAKADVDKALALNPDLPQAILTKGMLAAQAGRFAEAITDLQTLLHSDPKNKEYRLQLATYLVADKRPRRAIEVLDNLIEADASDADALRARGDALLSIGKHADAIADYENALKIEPDDTGVLNNLAWVLATSTEDGLRNGKRSIELAKKACELTKYEKPHILSTLASGYAETGNWDEARKWSEKAIAAGEGEVVEQLKKELESYKEKKPWREKQETEENTKPIEPKTNDLET